MDFKNQLAAQEVQRWRHLFPKAQGASAILPAPTGTGGVSWVNLGPKANLTDATFSSIDSGRPVAIVPHPTVATTLYLATSGGGVFKCTNADITQAAADWVWTPITDDLPASGSSGNVSIGAMASLDGNTLFVGMGDPFDAQGRGFFKSPDGGTSWTAATGLGAQTRSYSILPLTASKIFWGTNDGLKVSNDGGATFAAVAGGPATGQAWTVRKITATELICSVQATTGSIYTSADSGSTWTLASITGVPAGITIGRITLAAATDGATAYGILEDTVSGNVARGVIKSTDKGHTWTWMPAPTIAGGLFQGTGPQMTTDGGQGFYNHGLGVDPTNPARLVVGANLALYRSTDGGASWTQLTHWFGSGHPYTHADNHSTAWFNGTLFVANDGGLSILKDPWRATVPTTTDDLTFIDNRRNKGLASHLVYNVGSSIAAAPADSKYRISLGLQDNGTRVRQPVTPGGTLTGTEVVFEDGIGGDGFGTQIHPTDGTQILGSVYYTDIWKSTNGGTTFVESISGITEANNATLAPFAPKIALGATSTPSTVYTAVNSKVYQSTNFGSTWTAMPMGTFTASGRVIRNLNGSRGSSAVGLASSGGHFWTTYNSGASWTDSGDITVGALNTSYIWFNTENDQTVYGATVAPDATAHHLFKSTNGGATWTSIDGSATTSNGLPFGIPVHVIQNLPGSLTTLFAGTDFGVYRSLDGGSTWARYGNNLPLVAARDLYIAPNGSFIRAGTYGRGVWEVITAVQPTVALAPTSVTLVNGGTQSFIPTVANGTANTVTWASASGGTVPAGATATGVAQTYTAPASGTTDTVTVTTVDAPAATAQAAITLVAPTSVTVAVSPTTVELLTGTGTQAFSATVSPISNQVVTWSGTGVNAGTGLFSATGLAAGPYTVTATSQAAPTRSGTATVTLVAPGSVTVGVSPTPKALFVGGTQTFTATVTGPTQATNRTVTWSTSGGGTITSGGLFTATTVGSFTITATNTFSGATGTASITVSAAKSLDLNGDGLVDALDLLTFAKYYGTANAACDLNGDGLVDDADLALLLAGL
jgi:hypothetical protein